MCRPTRRQGALPCDTFIIPNTMLVKRNPRATFHGRHALFLRPLPLRAPQAHRQQLALLTTLAMRSQGRSIRLLRSY